MKVSQIAPTTDQIKRKLFDFDYGYVDDSMKDELEDGFVNRYYHYELATYSFPDWKRRLTYEWKLQLRRNGPLMKLVESLNPDDTLTQITNARNESLATNSANGSTVTTNGSQSQTTGNQSGTHNATVESDSKSSLNGSHNEGSSKSSNGTVTGTGSVNKTDKGNTSNSNTTDSDQTTAHNYNSFENKAMNIDRNGNNESETNEHTDGALRTSNSQETDYGRNEKVNGDHNTKATHNNRVNKITNGGVDTTQTGHTRDIVSNAPNFGAGSDSTVSDKLFNADGTPYSTRKDYDNLKEEVQDVSIQPTVSDEVINENHQLSGSDKVNSTSIVDPSNQYKKTSVNNSSHDLVSEKINNAHTGKDTDNSHGSTNMSGNESHNNSQQENSINNSASANKENANTIGSNKEDKSGSSTDTTHESTGATSQENNKTQSNANSTSNQMGNQTQNGTNYVQINGNTMLRSEAFEKYNEALDNFLDNFLGMFGPKLFMRTWTE